MTRIEQRLQVLLLLFLVTSDAHTDILFEDISILSGIDHVSPTFGASWGDFNSDGYADLWVGNHYSKPSLYLNNRNGGFTDIIDNVWSADIRDVHGAAWFDVDNDGDEDIIEVSGGGVSNHLWINNGSTLVDSADLYLLGSQLANSRSRTPLVLDWNHDTLYDLLISQYTGRGDMPVIFRNYNETFVDTSLDTGVTLSSSAFASYADLNSDRVMDIAVHSHSDYPAAVYDPSTLPFNNLAGYVTFPVQGGSSAEDVLIADLDNDLDNDIFFTKQASNKELVVHNERLVEYKIPVVRTSLAVDIVTSGRITISGYFVFGIDANSRVTIGSNQHSVDQFDYDPDLLTENFTVTLDPADSRTHGLYAYLSGTDQGVYIGFDPVTSTWSIHYSTPVVEVVNFRITSEFEMTQVTPIGFNAAPPQATPHLWLQTLPGIFNERRISNGFTFPLPCVSVVGADFDNDMDIDIYLSCTNPVQNLPNRLFLNDGNGVFSEAGPGDAIGSMTGRGESVATADFNNDGFIDLFVTNGNDRAPFHLGPHQLFLNPGNSNNWIEIDLEGTTVNSKGTGSSVIVTAGGISQIREQNSGSHKYSQNQQRLHFGLAGHELIERIEVLWPNRETSVIHDVEPNSIITIKQGEPDYYLKEYLSAGKLISANFTSLSLRFDNILLPGFVKLYRSPTHLLFGNQDHLSDFMSLESAADFEGDIEICMAYSLSTSPSPSSNRIVIKKLEGDTWSNIPGTSVNEDDNTICGTTDSLSDFVVSYAPNNQGNNSNNAAGGSLGFYVFVLITGSIVLFRRYI